MTIPRLRMFAGPNGSGKSTLKGVVPPSLLGVYLNPDEIQSDIARRGYLDCQAYQVVTTRPEILSFLSASALLRQADLLESVRALRWHDGRLDFTGVTMNAYFASVVADFLRRKLLDQGLSLSFETVMSAPDKITLLGEARRLGYRTYLYYVATDDPAINCARVQARVRQGGHDVPVDKIVSRYHRSLDLLLDAIRATDRAYLFDNSRAGGGQTWVAEVTGGHDLTIRTSRLPAWFQRAVWNKITIPTPTVMPSATPKV